MPPVQEDVPSREVTAAWQQALAEVGEKPALAGLVARRGTALFRRFRLWYARLQGLGRGAQRRWRRRLGLGLAGAALLLALTGGPGLGAAVTPVGIVVTNSTSAIAASDGCSLPEAIINANNDDQSGSTDCATGYSGLDTITLDTDVTLTDVNNSTYGHTGLPVVTSAITIEGNDHTISRDASASSDFRIMAVSSGGDLTLNSATISGGVAAGSAPELRWRRHLCHISGDGGGDEQHPQRQLGHRCGGGIYARLGDGGGDEQHPQRQLGQHYGGGIFANSATVSVTNSTLSANSASSRRRRHLCRSATVAVTNSTLSGNSASTTAAASLPVGDGVCDEQHPQRQLGQLRRRHLCLSATVAVTNSTLSGNSAIYGGGIYARVSDGGGDEQHPQRQLGQLGGGGIYAVVSDGGGDELAPSSSATRRRASQRRLGVTTGQHRRRGRRRHLCHRHWW